VKLTVSVKLQPAPNQAKALLATLERANEAANAVSRCAWESQTFRQYALQKLVYHSIKAEFDLTAQVVVRLIAKVADVYKLDRKAIRVFRAHGSIAYDDRILRWYSDRVSIWTLKGRESIPFTCGEKQRELLASRQGESDLVLRDGQWYLLATVNYTEPPEGTVLDVLGVDLGIVNIATDSDGNCYSGAHVLSLRHRHRRLRARLKRKYTRSAKRLFAKRRRKEQRFATHVNHCISKKIVAEAEGTGRGIALEDLQGIHDRITVRRPQRVTISSWSFHQLRSFIEYKARMAGVPVIAVDPRNTSRTCPACGHCEKANRPSQERFFCKSCGLAGLADFIAAVNIRVRGRGIVSCPDADAVGSASPQTLLAGDAYSQPLPMK
jgi:putative transposase